MSTMNLDDSVSDRVDDISCAAYQEPSGLGERSLPGTINPHMALIGRQWSHPYDTLPYEVRPESDATTNIMGSMSFDTPISAFDHVNRNNQTSPASNIPFQTLNQYSPQQRSHCIIPETTAAYTNSCSDGYSAQQYSASDSIAGSPAGNTYFYDSGLGTALWKNNGSSGNSFGTSAPTHQSFLQFPAIDDAPQNPQNLLPPPSSRPHNGSSLLEVPTSTRCSHCGTVSARQSDHKKHMARHEKPHRCLFPSCDAGFATASDLDRHKRSKHMTSSHEGQPCRLHSCPVESCKSRGRMFPRLDNFRNHLRNKHNLNEDVVERLVDSSKRSVSGSSSHRRRGQIVSSYTTSPQSSMAWNLSINTRTDLIQNTGGFTYDYSQGTIQNPPQKIVELDMPALSAQSPREPLPQSLAPTAWPSHSGSMNKMVTLGHDVSQLQIPSSPGNLSPSAGTPMRSAYSSEAGSPFNRNDYEHIRQAADNIGFDLVPRPQREEASAELPRRSQKQRSKHADKFDSTCKTCLRLDGEKRTSDLKKHLTRYLHMFFCTDARCEATFGSKDELRRHENCTHENFERWKCILEIKERGELCGYESFHSHAFKDHLKSVHPDSLDANGRALDAEGFRIVDENFPVHFWCGFCKHRFETIGDAPQRVRARLNHFEDHLKGRNKWERGTVHTWVPEPVGGSQVAGTLNCQQHSKTIAPIRHQSCGPSAQNQSPEEVSSPSADIPRIVIPDQQLDIKPQDSLGQPPQASSYGRGSNSGYSRHRKRNTTKTCCQCLDFLVGWHHVCCSNCGHQIEGCATCITGKMSFEELENADQGQP